MSAKLSTKQSWIIAGVLLAIMAGLMLGAARQDSATVDETTFLSAGYTYWKGHRCYFVPEHPPVSQLWPAVPLLWMNVKLSGLAQDLLDARVSYPWTRPWEGQILSMQGFIPPGCGGHYVDLKQPPFHRLIGWECTGAYPLQNWYLWALPESQIFGQMLVYDGTNNGDAMLFAGRCMQILLTLGLGLLIFVWIRRTTKSEWAALLGLAFWAFNPSVLAHGHLTTTDMGATFGMALAIFAFGLVLEKPSLKGAVFWGLATGLALLMKLTAVILAPVFLVLIVLHWKKLNSSSPPLWKLIGTAVLACWAIILAAYFPHWTPPPAASTADAQALHVPGWFTSFRPLLIPPDFFKALGLTLGHSKEGHDAFLMGEWSNKGWLSYYPLTFVFKSSIAFVVSTLIGVILLVRGWKNTSPLERSAWVGAVVYFALAMSSNASIGIRHILPVIPLLCVGISCRISQFQPAYWKKLMIGVAAWQAIIAIVVFPLYLQFFSEIVGGSDNGYQYLVDSNYDWGQDAKRLKDFVTERHIDGIYLDYFGTQYNIEYLKIRNMRVSAENAHQIKQGWLVVSVSQLMRPEWAWLRDSRPPTARIAHTLFAYEFR